MLVDRILNIKNIKNRNEAITKCFNFSLSYLSFRNDYAYKVTSQLLATLNNIKDIENREIITRQFNPQGWCTLKNACTFHPLEIISNLKLYIEIKQAYKHIGQRSFFFFLMPFYESATFKIETARKLITMIEKKSPHFFISSGNQCFEKR